MIAPTGAPLFSLQASELLERSRTQQDFIAKGWAAAEAKLQKTEERLQAVLVEQTQLQTARKVGCPTPCPVC